MQQITQRSSVFILYLRFNYTKHDEGNMDSRKRKASDVNTTNKRKRLEHKNTLVAIEKLESDDEIVSCDTVHTDEFNSTSTQNTQSSTLATSQETVIFEEDNYALNRSMKRSYSSNFIKLFDVPSQELIVVTIEDSDITIKPSRPHNK